MEVATALDRTLRRLLSRAHSHTPATCIRHDAHVGVPHAYAAGPAASRWSECPVARPACGTLTCYSRPARLITVQRCQELSSPRGDGARGGASQSPPVAAAASPNSSGEWLDDEATAAQCSAGSLIAHTCHQPTRCPRHATLCTLTRFETAIPLTLATAVAHTASAPPTLCPSRNLH